MNRSWRRVGWMAAALGLVSGLALLFFFDPAQYAIYPFCPFHRITGLLCPGCGGLRALHQLLHGHVAAAFRLNALLVILLPLGTWLTLRELIRLTVKGSLPGPVPRPFWAWTLLAALILFTILRNIHA